MLRTGNIIHMAGNVIFQKKLLTINIIYLKAVKVALNWMSKILIHSTSFYFCTFARILYKLTATSH